MHDATVDPYSLPGSRISSLSGPWSDASASNWRGCASNESVSPTLLTLSFLARVLPCSSIILAWASLTARPRTTSILTPTVPSDAASSGGGEVAHGSVGSGPVRSGHSFRRGAMRNGVSGSRGCVRRTKRRVGVALCKNRELSCHAVRRPRPHAPQGAGDRSITLRKKQGSLASWGSQSSSRREGPGAPLGEADERLRSARTATAL